MLIEFSVSNFRSIRNRVTLSMVAKRSDKSLLDNLLDMGNLPGLKNYQFLSVAGIYGANASGKTNVIRAMHFMRNTVLNSFTDMKLDEPFAFSPFLLDVESREEPTEFECVFVYHEIRYRYGFSLTRERVLEEWLFTYPVGKEQVLFLRTYDAESESYNYKFGNNYGSDFNLGDQTRENTLVVSAGTQLKHDTPTLIYSWFKYQLSVRNLAIDGSFFPEETIELLTDSEDSNELVENFLHQADFGIIGINVQEEPFDPDTIPDSVSDEVKKKLTDTLKDEVIIEVNFEHESEIGESIGSIDLKEESAGTQRFFALAGPILASLRDGTTLIIDEIGASLHPKLTRFIVTLYGNKDINDQGAQLIFSTHDSTLLDTDLLRRDQFWFTEKDTEGSTRLVPLTDFKTRNKEALQRGYLSGRYGAIPSLDEEYSLSD